MIILSVQKGCFQDLPGWTGSVAKSLSVDYLRETNTPDEQYCIDNLRGASTPLLPNHMLNNSRDIVLKCTASRVVSL